MARFWVCHDKISVVLGMCCSFQLVAQKSLGFYNASNADDANAACVPNVLNPVGDEHAVLMGT